MVTRAGTGGRPRVVGRLGPGDAQYELAEWLDGLRRQAGLSHRQIAVRLHRSRSGVTSALLASSAVDPVPPWELIGEISRICRASRDEQPAAVEERIAEARRRWEAAMDAQMVHAARMRAGWPPPGLRDLAEYHAALQDLLDRRSVSQRQVAVRSGLASRSLVGAVLRGERGTTIETVTAILVACNVTGEAADAWAAYWSQLAWPDLWERRQRQMDGYRHRPMCPW